MANFSKIKKGNFYFNSIGKYFLKCEKASAFQVISDRTYQDLDLDEIFMYIDRTLSKVGQQFLFHSLRTIPGNSGRFDRFEQLIKVLNEHPKLKKTVIEQLSKLNANEAYFISSLFLEDHFQKPKWFFVVPLLSLISIVSLSLSLFFPQFLLVLLPVLAVNYFIHYWNRERFVQYGGSILQLLVLNQVAKEFVKAQILAEANEEISKSIQSIDAIGAQMSIFKLEAKVQSDVGQALESLTDIIKALFLIEPIVFFSVLKKLDSKKNEIHKLYKLIGEIDVAISIDSLRNELPYYTVPTLTDKNKQLRVKDIYHPLLLDSVANSIDIHQKSVLLTGSNMSGKTTFILSV